MVNLMELGGGAKGLGVLAITVAVVLAILGGFQDSTALTGAGNQTITDFIAGLGVFGDFAGIIALAIVGFFVLKYISDKA